MTTMNPELAISAHDNGDVRTYRFSFYMPRGTGYTAHCKTPVLAAKAGDSLAVQVSSIDVESDHLFSVTVGVDGTESDVVELARVTAVGVEPKEFSMDLLDSVQHALFTAMRSLVPTVTATASSPVVHQQVRAEHAATADEHHPGLDEPKAVWRRSPLRAAVLGCVVVVSVGLIGYGLVPPVGDKVGRPISADAVGTQDYSDMQKRIQTQIRAAANSATPAESAQNMDNVSIATMRAMGLDPGKANAGCLVGVK